MRRIFAVLALGLMVAPACSKAQPLTETSRGFAVPKEHPVRAELIAEHASIQPGGSTRVGVHFELMDGWHIYAEKPGDAGMPTKVSWGYFPGAHFGPLQWPKPEEFTDPGDIHTRGYAGAVVLFSELTLNTRETPAELPLKADVEWLACKEICIPGSAELSMNLPVTQAAPVFSPHAQLFEHTSLE